MDGFTSYVIERTLDAPRERVWRALVEPELLARWVWGAQARGVEAQLDVRPGGMFRVACPVRAGGRTETWQFRGIYAAVEPPARLVHTVHWDASVGYNDDGANPVDELVAIELEDDGGRTRLRYAHSGIPDDGQSAAEHERSVRATLDALASLVETAQSAGQSSDE